ncbi:hypothetical protein WHR41_00891 [Cladosporium halotolerans]|uniref:MARVEL domain-containing protein n=1 Tax=Cladosporium halotolerans TaxID=1052096 RepID=A0AB34L5E5_9PEZI
MATSIRDWESRRTHQAWGTGWGSPALMVLVCLVVNVVSLIVSIAVNATVANRRDNDYGYGTGWILMTIAPATSLLWTLIDVVLCHYSVLHPIYYLVEGILLLGMNLSLAIISILFFAWDKASWVPGIFMAISAIVYIGVMYFSARLIHENRKRPQSRGSA